MIRRDPLFACAIALAALLPVSARAQIPGTANIQVGGTNIIGGTSGRCLFDNAGKVGETASCGLAGGITVGTSVITGGTTTRVLFDNAGVLGEYTISGSGNVAMTTNPVFTTPSLGAATATTVNGAAFTACTTCAVTLANGATLTGTSSTSVGRGQYQGTSTNDTPTAGNIGELISAVVNIGGPVSLTNNVTANITSVSLTAGDWDVSTMVCFLPAATTTISYMLGGSSATSATRDQTTGREAIYEFNGLVLGNAGAFCATAPATQYLLSSTTTVFLVATSSFGVSTNGAYGIIRARRMR